MDRDVDRVTLTATLDAQAPLRVAPKFRLHDRHYRLCARLGKHTTIRETMQVLIGERGWRAAHGIGVGVKAGCPGKHPAVGERR